MKIILEQENGERIDTTLERFLDENNDIDIPAIHSTLAAGQPYYGGGGASPFWTLHPRDSGEGR